MLTVDSETFRKINLDENDVKAVVVNTGNEIAGVWGKRLNLSSIPDIGVSIKIERISSPYQHAEIKTLTLQDPYVYWGDVLRLTAYVDTGYTFTGFEINSEAVSQNPTETTCSTDLIMAIKAHATHSASWHTVFSGTYETTHNTSTSAKTYNITISGLRANVTTRVTGKLMKESNTVISTFSGQTLPISLTYNSKTQSILQVTTPNTLSVTLQRPTPTMTNKAPYFIITKIEQYY